MYARGRIQVKAAAVGCWTYPRQSVLLIYDEPSWHPVFVTAHIWDQKRSERSPVHGHPNQLGIPAHGLGVREAQKRGRS